MYTAIRLKCAKPIYRLGGVTPLELLAKWDPAEAPMFPVVKLNVKYGTEPMSMCSG